MSSTLGDAVQEAARARWLTRSEATGPSTGPRARRWLLTLLAAALLAGCAGSQPRPHASEAVRCEAVLQEVDTAVAEAGVADAMNARVAGFAHLRVNRFLASYADEPLTESQFADWVRRMGNLGREAYAIELANLPRETAVQLSRRLETIAPGLGTPSAAMAHCTNLLASRDAQRPEGRDALRAAARVADDYSAWRRILGLYWLTRIPFAAGVQRWQARTLAVHAQSLESLPVLGELRRFVPPPDSLAALEAERILRDASSNPMGVPDPAPEDLERLFRAHAPVYVVDVAGGADLPGALGWGGRETPAVVSTEPVVYRRVSHARYREQVLLQLNYAIWFPERPARSSLDLLAGRLDGVVWRVTLAPDGRPWIYDSIHPCGCYHLFFPTARARARAPETGIDESALVPHVLTTGYQSGSRIVLRLESGTHYLQRVSVEPRTTAGWSDRQYTFAHDDALRSLRRSDGERRSLFGPDGIVAGSERAERFLFWPMGIASAGAMRQWGRHATAFVGRRHFDDARLLERYFALVDESAGALER